MSIALATVPATAEDNDKKTIVTFSGGGYHALSGAASWMMGMMARNPDSDGNPASLASVTSNVKAFGSNSGGSWFMSLSAYSPTFLAGLEAGARNPDVFTSSGGYMGLAWDRLQTNNFCSGLFNNSKKCEAFEKEAEAAGLKGLLDLVASGGGQWQYSINNDVFGDAVTLKGKTDVLPYFAEVSGKKLSDKPLDWLGSTPWILAGTFLTDAPSLTGTGLGNLTTQSLQGHYTQAFSGAFSQKPIPGGVPVMLTGTDGIDFLPTGDLTLQYGSYKKNAFNPYSDVTTTIVNNNMNSAIRDMPVMHAAGISSAAGGGFIDIPDLHQTIEFSVDTRFIATKLNGMAPGYQMDSGSGTSMMKFIDNVHEAFAKDATSDKAEDWGKALRDHKVARMADGGFMDNTAVVQMLRYLQDKSGKGVVPDGFNIVTFDDFPVPQTKWNGASDQPMPTGNDVASLFGFAGCAKKGDKDCSVLKKDELTHQSKLLMFKFTGISPHVFDCGAYFSNGDSGCIDGEPLQTPVYWSPTPEEAVQCKAGVQPLIYAKYDVTVNEDLPGSQLWGLKTNDKGSTGTLHVFSILGGGAAVVPGNEEGMDCYREMVGQIMKNVTAKASDSKKTCDTSKPRQGVNQCTLGDYLEAALKE